MISGKNNIRNTRLFRTHDPKFNFKAVLGDGTKRYYQYKSKNNKSAYFLIKEEKPNGTEVHYEYEKFDLKEIKAKSKTGLTLGKIVFGYDKYKYKIYGNHGRHASYELAKFFSSQVIDQFDEEEFQQIKALSNVIPAHAPPKQYRSAYFFENNVNMHIKVWRVEKPDGRFLEVDYQSSTGKVSSLSAPVGLNNEKVVTHRFDYEDNHTIVTNAKGEEVIYRYGDDYRLQTIDFLENKVSHHKQEFIWNKDLLQAKAFTDKKGKAYNLTKYTYDDRGNVLREHLYGNLSGKASEVFEFDSKANPAEPIEEYVKEFTYTNDGFNLLSSEKDPDGLSVEYRYIPNTNLLTSKLIKSNEQIVKRLFNSYDENYFLVQTVEDDGFSSVEGELHGVTERKITRFENELKNSAAIGKPKIVKQLYLNLEKHKEILLSKTQYSYDNYGQISQEDRYDANGKLAYSLKTTYTDHGLIKTQTDPLGREFHYFYDANDNKIQEELMGSGKITYLTYDHADRLISKKERHADLAFEEIYAYNTLSQMISKIDTFGNETKYEYDTFGRLVKTILPEIEISQREKHRPTLIQIYDASGNVISKTDAKGYETKTTYTAYGKPITITYPDGGIEQFEYYLNGRLFKHVNQLGAITEYRYDSLGNLIEEITKDSKERLLKKITHTYKGYKHLTTTDAKGILTEYSYDNAGRKIKETVYGEDNPHVKSFEYDTLGRIYKTHFHPGRVEVQLYDNLNRVIEERVEEENGTLHTKKQYVYDLHGNIEDEIQFISADESAITTTKYLSNGLPYLIKDPSRHKTHITYDYNYLNALNQKVLKRTTVDSLGNQTIEILDSAGNISSIEKKDSQGILLSSQLFWYDPNGNLAIQKEARIYQGIAQGKFIVHFEYDSMNRLSKTREQKQKETSYRYDYLGNQTRQIKPDNNKIKFDYDVLGRLVSRNDSFKTIDEKYYYDVNDNLLQVENLINKTLTNLVYNSYNELIQETLANGLTVSYAYDALSRPLKMTLPDASILNYSYNALGLVQVERGGYTHTYNKRDLSGKLVEAILPHDTGKLSFFYDSNSRLKTFNAPSFSQTLTYDSLSNLLGYTQTDSLGTLNASFSYDSLYQLKTESGVANHTYECDSLKNHLSKNGIKRQHTSLNELKTDENGTYTYDLNGNLLSKPGLKLSYDGLNRLVQVQKGELKYVYTYDSFNRRISKSIYQSDQLIDKEDYLYQSKAEIATFKNNKIEQLRVLGIGKGGEVGAAVLIEINNKPYVPIHNHRGDLSSLIDLDTKSSTAYRYEAYGLESSSSEINNPWRYASKHYDEETGFVYFGERFYDPTLTRWINPDPAGFIDGLNTYAYVGNNPLRFFDAYGLSDEDLHSLPNAHRPMDRSPSSSSWQGIKNDLRDTARDCTVAFLDSYINPIDSVIDRCSNDSNSIYSNFENIKGLSNWEFFKKSMREQVIQSSRDLGIVASAYSATAVFRTIKTAVSLGYRGLTYAFKAIGREGLKTEGKYGVKESIQVIVKEEIKQTSKITQLEKILERDGFEISLHALKRMKLRGITPKMIEVALKKGVKYYDPKNDAYSYILKNGFASGKSLLVGQSSNTGKITTVIRGDNVLKSRFQLIE